MYFAWGFPLLHLVILGQEMDGLNTVLSGMLAIMLVAVGLWGLIRLTNGNEEYEKGSVQLYWLCILAGLILWVIGFMPILLAVFAWLIIWHVIWKILIHWFLWRVLARNFWYATWGTIPEPEVRTRRTRTKPAKEK